MSDDAKPLTAMELAELIEDAHENTLPLKIHHESLHRIVAEVRRLRELESALKRWVASVNREPRPGFPVDDIQHGRQGAADEVECRLEGGAP